MKSIFRSIPLLLFALGTYCSAEPGAIAKDEAIEMKSVSKNGITSVTFRKSGALIYRLVFKEVVISRLFCSDSNIKVDLKVTEYDLDSDGKLDAIQIGKDDSNFTPFMITIEEGRIDVEALPDNWKDGQKYAYDAFISFVKKRKGIK